MKAQDLIQLDNVDNWYCIARVGFIDGKEYLIIHGLNGVLWDFSRITNYKVK